MRLTAITTSSKAAFPARSPKPLTVVLTDDAPALIPASALAVAKPKSLWVWISRGIIKAEASRLTLV